MNDTNIGKWELGCLIFNSLIYKILTGYTRVFAQISGSAAWLTAVFSSLVFIVLLILVVKIYKPAEAGGMPQLLIEGGHRSLSKVVSAAAVIYFIFSSVYSLYIVIGALKSVAYPNSPVWFLVFFLLLGAVFTNLCGRKAVFRMHSLFTLGIGVTVLLIALLGLKYSDISNLAPILGSGAQNVFGSGLSALFLYSDILIIFFLPRTNDGKIFSRTVVCSAAAAAILNAFTVTVISLSSPFELIRAVDLPIYPLTKTDVFGKFPFRLDLIYLTSLITSAILYLSVSLRIIFDNLKSLRISKSKAGTVVGIFLCVTLLCGCYDKSEVEENAYLIALGIDKGEVSDYKFTFQISNPLKSGGSVGAEEKAAESDGDDEGNTTVDNIVIEANSYDFAANKLKSVLSKSLVLSHLKLIVCSLEVAYAENFAQNDLFIREYEMRPDTNICLAKSASDFLMNVNPTLEENTVRYYELMFKENEILYAPTAQLRSFIGGCIDDASDKAVPIVSSDGLCGMGLFSDGRLKAEADGNEVVIYKLLLGELESAPIHNFNSQGTITSCGKPKIFFDFDNFQVVNIEIPLRLSDDIENQKNVISNLVSEAEKFMKKTSEADSDILGIGKKMKKKCSTQAKWQEIIRNIAYKNVNFDIKIILK